MPSVSEVQLLGTATDGAIGFTPTDGAIGFTSPNGAIGFTPTDGTGQLAELETPEKLYLKYCFTSLTVHDGGCKLNLSVCFHCR